jgi:5-methylcytosine-specific restriction endonuclease McrA
LILTKEFLDSNKTPNGGWNYSQLALLGVGWPPKKGWKKLVIGREFPNKTLVMFAKYGKDRPIGELRKEIKNKALTKKKRRRTKLIKAAPVICTTSDDFLLSYEWRKLRMEALKKYGARCQCCGATRADGIKIHVDHIKPRKRYPELALDIGNLQVLCEVCNHGKGNWDNTDWRNGMELTSEDGRLTGPRGIHNFLTILVHELVRVVSENEGLDNQAAIKDYSQ